MKIVVLQDDLFAYLQHIVKAYAAAGIDPEEGLAVFHINQAIKGAQNVDDSQVAKITAGEDIASVATVKSTPPEPPEERGVKKGAA